MAEADRVRSYPSDLDGPVWFFRYSRDLAGSIFGA